MGFETVICSSVTVSGTHTDSGSAGSSAGFHFHGDLLLVNQYVADVKHNGKVIVQVNHAPVITTEGYQSDQVHLLQLF